MAKKQYKKKRMAMGGQIPVELEGGEMFEVPGMEQALPVSGPSHAEGGVDMTLPEGTTVYSDRITIDGKTLAERKASRDRKINKLNKLLDGYPDQLTKNTVERKRTSIFAEDDFDKAIMDATNGASNPQKLAYGSSAIEQNLVLRQLPPPVLNKIEPLSLATPTTAPRTIDSSKIPIFNPVAESTQEENSPSFLDALGGPVGAAGTGVGLISSIFGAIGGIANTKSNAEATKNLNKDYWMDFGLDSLLTNREAQDRVEQNKSAAKREADRKLAIEGNTQRARNRASAVGINQLRALDTITDLGMERTTVEGVNNAEQIYGNQLLQLLQQQGQIELQRDQMTMSSQERLQDAEEQRIDNFYTQMGQDFANISTTGQQIGANINKVAQNYNELGWLNDASQYLTSTASGTTNKTKRRRRK